LPPNEIKAWANIAGNIARTIARVANSGEGNAMNILKLRCRRLKNIARVSVALQKLVSQRNS
jgi:hypothetical protein